MAELCAASARRKSAQTSPAPPCLSTDDAGLCWKYGLEPQLQNRACNSRTDEIPVSGPKISTHNAIDPGGGGNSTWPSWAHGQVDAIPLVMSPAQAPLNVGAAWAVPVERTPAATTAAVATAPAIVRRMSPPSLADGAMLRRLCLRAEIYSSRSPAAIAVRRRILARDSARRGSRGFSGISLRVDRHARRAECPYRLPGAP